MTLLFELILLTSLLVIGWTIITQPKMGLGFIRETFEDTSFEPFLICHWCMPSTWSLFGYFFSWQLGFIEAFSWKLIWMYPLVVCGSSFLCGLSWALYQMISKVKDNNEIQSHYYTHVEEMAFFDLQERKKKHLEKKNNNH